MTTSLLPAHRASWPGRFRPRGPFVLLAALAALAASASGCAASQPKASSVTNSTTDRAITGSVDVLYAGSLVDLMESQVGPDFQSATGVALVGTSGDSGSLANEIKGKVLAGDVFISASAQKDVALQGATNGDWVSWYATFARSPLVLGYDPKSRFAPQLRSRPWYDVVGASGFLLGRTDPATDPKGQLTVQALDDAAAGHHRPALAALAGSTGDVFAENSLIGRLQAGQLDAGFLYSVEAKAAGLPAVSLSGSNLSANYTITVLAHAAHPRQAVAFVRYLLGPKGAADLGRAGLQLSRPFRLIGTPPSALQDTLR